MIFQNKEEFKEAYGNWGIRHRYQLHYPKNDNARVKCKCFKKCQFLFILRSLTLKTRLIRHSKLAKENITAWKVDEKVWIENVLHIEEDINFSSPYELNPEKRESSESSRIRPYFDRNVADLSEKELLLKITKERGLSGETVAGIVGVVQQGVALQQERSVRSRPMDEP